MAPSSPNVSAPSSASTLPRSQTSSATPRSPPDWRSTAPGTVKIPEPIVTPTTMRTRSRSVRTRASSRGATDADTITAARRWRCHVTGSGRPPDIGRPHASSKRRPYGLLEVAGRLGMPQLLEHQGAREHRGDWVRDPFASERGRRAVHWLEQSGPARVKVGARREAEPAHEPGAQVRENVSVEIVRDDHLEPLRLAHQLHRQCVHV